MQACHLSAIDIACRRGDRIVFRGLSLELNSGGALHIAGPNGIGKSSLIRILAGLLRPYGGGITREGAVALLDERPALDPQISLGDGLTFWAELDGTTINEEWAETLGIADLLDVPFRYLSTGQRKRAAFLRVLMQDAPIWLLDEPLNGLDDHAQETIARLIQRHCTGGGLCILASHQSIDLPGGTTLALAEYAP